MELICKHFSELTASELYERLTVCASRSSSWSRTAPIRMSTRPTGRPGISGLQDDGRHRRLAQARLARRGRVFPDVSIGRVTAVRRREGLGRRIVLAAIGAAKKHFGARRITIEAQSYVKTLYTALGFTQTGPEFLEDGIPHVPMQLQL